MNDANTISEVTDRIVTLISAKLAKKPKSGINLTPIFAQVHAEFPNLTFGLFNLALADPRIEQLTLMGRAATAPTTGAVH